VLDPGGDVGERLGWGIAAGGALILAGMLLTDRAEAAGPAEVSGPGDSAGSSAP
jgi:hypothetical protein